MNRDKFSLKNIPGWVIMLVLFGVLYATGLHTEVIGQAQRLLLATGLKKAEVPASAEPVAGGTSLPGSVGTGFQMMDLDGNPVSFESLHGKVVFLNIWATWCPPCVAEMPNIQALYEKVGSDQIAFVLLSVDKGGLEKVRNYIARKGYTFPVYLPVHSVPEEFQSPSIPTTFILSPEGKIVSKHVGLAEYDTEEMRAFLTGMTK